MLKRLKECLHQQNAVISFSGLSRNTKLIAFWTCLSRILMHHPTFIENRSSPSFPWARKDKEIHPSLSAPKPSLLSPNGFMWWSAWKWNQGSMAGSLAKKSGKSYYSERSNFMKSRMCIAIVQATLPCIRGSRIPTSRMSTHPQWKMEPASACSTMRRTTNISRNWTKSLTKKIVNWTPEINTTLCYAQNLVLAKRKISWSCFIGKWRTETSNFMKSRMSTAIVSTTNASEDHAWANTPIKKIEPALNRLTHNEPLYCWTVD